MRQGMILSRAALRAVEREHGGQATRYGRLLNDLVAGSHAWDLWEGPPRRETGMPRLHALSVSEPVLRLMRESGELAERERLLRERDSPPWPPPGGASEATDEARWLAAETVQDEYFAAVRAYHGFLPGPL